MGDVMKESVFSLAEAKFTTGDFNHMVLQNVSKAQLKVRSKRDNVAGQSIHVYKPSRVKRVLITFAHSEGSESFKEAGDLVSDDWAVAFEGSQIVRS